MCLNPVSITNPTKRISRLGGQKLLLSVNCNKCAECQTRKRDEYSFRTYWHTKTTIENGGYVLFDTLTYSPLYLPHISHYIDISKYGIQDFSCFDLEHYKLFFKRLRRAIQYKYNVTDAITYFFTTEYGDDDNYTHRPHYHILIFVKYSFIHPLWLSRKIAQIWQFGRTDGITYKPLKYVAKHVYGYDLGFGINTSTWILRAVTHYVAKYILKSIDFQKVLDKRIYELQNTLISDEEIKELVKRISMFHRQSQGYGIGFLDNLSENDIEALKTDTCLLPDKEKIVKELPLPMYYMRKLYYQVLKSTTGNKVWQLTDKGIAHKNEKQLLNLTNREQRLNDLLTNVTQEQKSHFYSLLGNRTILDYCIYMEFYQGRLRCLSSKQFRTGSQPYYLNESEYLDTPEFRQNIADSYKSNTMYFKDVFEVDDKDNINMRNKYVSIISHDYNVNRVKQLTKKQFVRNYCFSENSIPQFKNFDLLTSYINHLKKDDRKNKQLLYDALKDAEQRLKDLKPCPKY